MDDHAPFRPDYAFDGEPAPGSTIEVAPGIHWLRMPLPFKLNHINLWLLEDGDGWTIVDTGICRDEVKEQWQQVWDATLGGRPVTRLIVTHFHPDHAGLAGWLVERWGCEFHMPRTEWAWGRMLSLDTEGGGHAAYRRFYAAAGFDEEKLSLIGRRIGRYAQNVATFPPGFRHLGDGTEISIGGRIWRVITGHGHAPEHACLWCDDAKVMIAGDQVLPRISPNVSVWPQEPEADPLALFLESLAHIETQVSDEALVLPSHDWPFHGLHGRLRDLASHHADRLDETRAACGEEGASAVEVLRHLFTRELDEHQLFFAVGETLSHLHRLMAEGRVTRETEPDGVHIYRAV